MSAAVMAQEGYITKLMLETRLDYMQEYISSDKIEGGSGFKGKYLNFRIDGNLTDKISYSYRQRLNKPSKDATFFDATDWITLTYTIGNWGFSGGKQVVAIGGYEYDKAPIDVYFSSEYWNHIACYQLGVSAAYTLSSGNDTFKLQFCESPFRKNAFNVNNDELFAYNLMWTSRHGVFNSIYSVNMIEYLPGKFINYIAAGNRLEFNKLYIELDLMNRATGMKNLLGRDFTVIAELGWQPTEQFNIFAKVTHDTNKVDDPGDLCIPYGTNLTRYGAGLEYYPIKGSKSLRLHIDGCHTVGASPETTVLRPHQTIIDCGITWRMDMLNLNHKNK